MKINLKDFELIRYRYDENTSIELSLNNDELSLNVVHHNINDEQEKSKARFNELCNYSPKNGTKYEASSSDNSSLTNAIQKQLQRYKNDKVNDLKADEINSRIAQTYGNYDSFKKINEKADVYEEKMKKECPEMGFKKIGYISASTSSEKEANLSLLSEQEIKDKIKNKSNGK